jgi:hypothetical protein
VVIAVWLARQPTERWLAVVPDTRGPVTVDSSLCTSRLSTRVSTLPQRPCRAGTAGVGLVADRGFEGAVEVVVLAGEVPGLVLVGLVQVAVGLAVAVAVLL